MSFSRVITEDHEVVLSEWCHVVATCQVERTGGRAPDAVVGQGGR